MSSSATPCLRAAGWMSMEQLYYESGEAEETACEAVARAHAAESSRSSDERSPLTWELEESPAVEEAVQEIAGLARELAGETERERRLPEALLTRLRASGLMNAGAPR